MAFCSRSTVFTLTVGCLDMLRHLRPRWPERQNPCFGSKSMPATCRGSCCTRHPNPLQAGRAGPLVSQVDSRHARALRAAGHVGGLRIQTPDGRPIPWRRDEVDLYRVTCEVPPGVHEVRGPARHDLQRRRPSRPAGT